MQLIHSSQLKDLHFNVPFRADISLYGRSYTNMLLTNSKYKHTVQNLLGNLL